MVFGVREYSTIEKTMICGCERGFFLTLSFLAPGYLDTKRRLSVGRSPFSTASINLLVLFITFDQTQQPQQRTDFAPLL
jgi:hypothetical protein